MKFPNHISLDIKNSLILNSGQYWIINYLKQLKNSTSLFTNFYFNSVFFLIKKNLLLSDLTKNQQKFTLFFLYSNFSKKSYESKKKILFAKRTFKTIFQVQPLNKDINLNIFKKILNVKLINKTNKLWNLFNINFLKKERMYTKLKYSRTPQYDIVSGGTAAIFAGFLGFLICEKFGFELIDSGDFYFLFMYIVFISFFGRIFFKLITQLKASWIIISPKWLFLYFQNVSILLLKSIKSIF